MGMVTTAIGIQAAVALAVRGELVAWSHGLGRGIRRADVTHAAVSDTGKKVFLFYGEDFQEFLTAH